MKVRKWVQLRLRRVAVAVGVCAIVAIVAGARLGLAVWGRRSFDRESLTLAEKIDASRAHLSRLRFGGEVSRDVCPLLVEIGALAHVSPKPTGDASSEAEAIPGAAVQPSLLDDDLAGRLDLDAAATATACARLDVPNLLDGPGQSGPPIWHLGPYLVVDGHVRAARGDWHGAVERYIQAARFGAVVQYEDALVGADTSRVAWLAIARVVAMEHAEDIDLVAGAIDRFAPSDDALTPALTVRREWLRRAFDRVLDGRTPVPRASAPIFDDVTPFTRAGLRAATLMPAGALVGHAVGVLARDVDDVELVWASHDPAREEAIDGRLDVLNGSWNPLLHSESIWGILLRTMEEARGAHALARAAVLLARERSRTGRWPLNPPEPWPRDPCEPTQALRYQVDATGNTFRMWSVGYDARDDGGARRVTGSVDDPDDLVVEGGKGAPVPQQGP